jgi:hypothetical protein
MAASRARTVRSWNRCGKPSATRGRSLSTAIGDRDRELREQQR